jgi:hypothetical protein
LGDKPRRHGEHGGTEYIGKSAKIKDAIRHEDFQVMIRTAYRPRITSRSPVPTNKKASRNQCTDRMYPRREDKVVTALTIT